MGIFVIFTISDNYYDADCKIVKYNKIQSVSWLNNNENNTIYLMYIGVDLVNKGLVNKGLVNKGLVNKGLVNKGLVNKGLVNKGLVNKGLVNKDVILDQRQLLVVGNYEIVNVFRDTHPINDVVQCYGTKGEPYLHSEYLVVYSVISGVLLMIIDLMLIFVLFHWLYKLNLVY